jgi:hypothetical protein
LRSALTHPKDRAIDGVNQPFFEGGRRNRTATRSFSIRAEQQSAARGEMARLEILYAFQPDPAAAGGPAMRLFFCDRIHAKNRISRIRTRGRRAMDKIIADFVARR